MGECLVGMGNFFSYGKSVHKVRDFSKLKGEEKESEQRSGSNVDSPRKNRF